MCVWFRLNQCQFQHKVLINVVLPTVCCMSYSNLLWRVAECLWRSYKSAQQQKQRSTSSSESESSSASPVHHHRSVREQLATWLHRRRRLCVQVKDLVARRKSARRRRTKLDHLTSPSLRRRRTDRRLRLVPTSFSGRRSAAWAALLVVEVRWVGVLNARLNSAGCKLAHLLVGKLGHSYWFI